MSAMNTSSATIPEITPIFPYVVFLYLYSTLLAVSIPCYLFIFYHISITPGIHRALNNHVVILMLILFFVQAIVNTSLHLDHFRRGYYWPPSLNYCFFLYMIDYVIYLNGALLMVWASLERHILIFNTTFFNTRARRFAGHYLPMIFCILYPLIYYTYFILFYPCESYYDMNTLNCFAACFLWTSSVMAFYELLVNGFAPVCLVAFFSISLLLRVIYRKRQMGRQLTWRKNRKMTIQLLSIAISFLALNVGYFVLAIGQMVYDPNFGANYMVWFVFINVCTLQLIMPFLCLNTIPNVGAKLEALNPWHRRARVQPTTQLRMQTISYLQNNIRR